MWISFSLNPSRKKGNIVGYKKWNYWQILNGAAKICSWPLVHVKHESKKIRNFWKPRKLLYHIKIEQGQPATSFTLSMRKDLFSAGILQGDDLLRIVEEDKRAKAQEDLQRNQRELELAKKKDAQKGETTPIEVGHSFAQQLRMARTQKGWTQQVLAQKMQVSKSVIQDWELGKNQVLAGAPTGVKREAAGTIEPIVGCNITLNQFYPFDFFFPSRIALPSRTCFKQVTNKTAIFCD